MNTFNTKLGIAACIMLCSYCWAQTDSLYLKIGELASRKKFTSFIYRAVFVEPKAGEYPAVPAGEEGSIRNPYIQYEDRPIRHVIIVVTDPFGFQLGDSLARPGSLLQKAGNRLHITTRKWIISNKLLFKSGDALDPLALSESERLLRQSAFSNDVRIFVSEADPDEVDVYVRVQDKWTITAPLEVTAQQANVTLRDQNFLGLGYQFDQYLGVKTPGRYEASGIYSLYNIDNTYISSTLAYRTGNEGTSLGLAFDRPFFSPLTRWAGGLALAHNQRFYPYTDVADGTVALLNVMHMTYDLWGGRAFKFLQSANQLTKSHNLIVSARYNTTYFIARPREALAILGTHTNSSAAIGSAGFALQQFYKDKYIYRFGANEDVPTGLIVQLVYGVQKKEFSMLRYYTALEVARAAHTKIGYLSATLVSGVFFNRYYTNDITTRFDFSYFSDLVRLDGWYMRQFMNYSLLHGVHKLYGERLALTGSDLYGFDGGTLYGQAKMLMRLETVAYAPYNLVGFHIAPVLMCGYGMLGGPERALLRSTIYQAYSLGILFRNENLLNSTFQVSFGLYPYFPNGGSYEWKYNPVTSFTVRVRPFQIGKPDFIGY